MTIQSKSSVVRIIISVVAVILLCVLGNSFAYSPFLDQIDRNPNGGDFYPEDYYKIDPATIFSQLDQGELNTFSPVEASLDSLWDDNPSLLHWHQSEFIKVAIALNRFAGKDDFSEWKFYSVNFNASCEGDGNLFSYGEFVIYKPYWFKYKLYYEAREIVINPSSGLVRWGDGILYPRPVFGWRNISLDNFKLTAEDALLIAEENGGKQKRLNKGGNCNLSVIGNKNEWIVLYSPFAEYRIDSNTGKIIEIHEY